MKIANIYGSALTAAEIAELYDAIKPETPADTSGKIFSAEFAEGNKANETVLGTELDVVGEPTTVYDEELGMWIAKFDGENDAFEFWEMDALYEAMSKRAGIAKHLQKQNVH